MEVINFKDIRIGSCYNLYYENRYIDYIQILREDTVKVPPGDGSIQYRVVNSFVYKNFKTLNGGVLEYNLIEENYKHMFTLRYRV